jgi:hypothetical protein
VARQAAHYEPIDSAIMSAWCYGDTLCFTV